MEHGVVEIARGSYGPGPTHPLQGEGEGVSHLRLDLARRMAGPLGENDDLLLGEVGDRVDGR